MLIIAIIFALFVFFFANARYFSGFFYSKYYEELDALDSLDARSRVRKLDRHVL